MNVEEILTENQKIASHKSHSYYIVLTVDEWKQLYDFVRGIQTDIDNFEDKVDRLENEIGRLKMGG